MRYSPFGRSIPRFTFEAGFRVLLALEHWSDFWSWKPLQSCSRFILHSVAAKESKLFLRNCSWRALTSRKYQLRFFRAFLQAAVFLIVLAGSNLLGQACAPVSCDLVSWWKADSDATDFRGINNGTFVGVSGLSGGKVGQAFDFDGISQYVEIP